MRCRICALVAFMGIIVGMSLSAALMVQAQAPAGPNRPAQVPEDYIVTPFGYFHPSCVVHLAKGEELLEGGEVIQKADGTTDTVPLCEYPHYTARGEKFATGTEVNPPTISHSWIVSGNTSTGSSYGEILADWNVPSAPLSYNGQTVYFFPGLEDDSNDVSILQPVLGWNADFTDAWGIASWNCCPRGTADESSPVHVNTGDLIVGTVKSTCGSGTLSCPTWNITTKDQSTGQSTALNNTPSEGQTFNWAFGGVLEAYSIVRCSDYPPERAITFSPTLFDDNFNIIQNPDWSLNDYTSGLTPQCDYGGQASPDEVTLYFGSFTLAVSITGSGVVASTDGSINCPGTCTQTYQGGTQLMLYATAAQGWVFAGWSGACTGTGACSVDMTQDQTVSATFLPAYTLTVTTAGSGYVESADGSIDCGFLCSQAYAVNSVVTLNAYSYEGWSFSSWSGACSGNTPSCNVTMSNNESVGATFTQNSYTLTVTMSGQGTITSTDGFINCPGTCSHTYLSFTPVTLNASAAQGWNFEGWSGACTGVGACYLTMLGNYGVSAYFNQPGSGLQFSAVTPCRLVDTRPQNGGGGPIPGETSQTFDLSQLAQTKGCAGLSTATAYSLNVTLVPVDNQPVGYLTIWPAGLAQPMTSTMNSLDGRIKANAATVAAGTNSSVSVFVSNSANVVLDIDGYYGPSTSSTLEFYPLTPCRVLDTRLVDGSLGGPYLSSGHERQFPVLSSNCLIPSTAQAYSMNFTAVPYEGQELGYLTVWPFGSSQPVVSTLNNLTATIVANAAVVPAGTNGEISVYPSGNTHLVADINGYFATPGPGGQSLYLAPPCRVLDTRNGNGAFSGKLPVNVAGSTCAPPSNAQAYVLNATVIPSPTLSYLTLWPDGEGQPVVSTLNAIDGQITSNMAIVWSTNGSIDAYAAEMTQLILDISSYFAP